MRIQVYYLIEQKGCMCVEHQIVDGDYLEEEMDAIEYRLGKEPSFRFMPNKKAQLAILRDYMQTAFVDPLPTCWEFRQAFIEAQVHNDR